MEPSNLFPNQTAKPASKHPPPIQPKITRPFTANTARQIMRLKELEGECRVQDFQLLRVNYPKAIFFGILMTISVVGLLLLKYYTSLRVLLFYSFLTPDEAHLATHIHINASDKNQSICDIQLHEFEGRTRRVFIFKHLRYEFDQICLPLGLSFTEIILKRGIGDANCLDEDQVQRRVDFLGKNEHLVQVPNYFQYMFNTMTQPFFIFQYLVSTVYILQGQAIFGILMTFFAFFTTTINYLLLYQSYQQIKQTAEKHFSVTVLRGGREEIVDNVDLVTGDIYVPEHEIPCDSLLMNGEVFVDQSSLTGQSVPVPKFKLTHEKQIEQGNRWLYEGSFVKTKKERPLAMAINIGFASRKGRIIREILTKRPKQPQLLNKLIYFTIEVTLVSIILYVSMLSYMTSLNIETIMVFFRFLDVITYSIPPASPIYFNLAYSFCLVRLRQSGIYGTQSEKTIEGARIKTICFDKTGTLTHSDMRITSVFAKKQGKLVNLGDGGLTTQPMIADILGCCNSVEKIGDNYEGDEIDLEMFHHVKAERVSPPAQLQDVVRYIQVSNRLLEVLRINEYESRFQSMSVLYRLHRTNRYFVVAKGSPEMIHSYSQTKIKGFDGFIKELSLQGFRSIAFGCREISERQIYFLLKAEREAFLKGIDLLGVATFVNLLKKDAQSTIRTLTQCDINTKIITGDNIFLGVHTALMTGMIRNGVNVIVVEGKKCKGGRFEITELKRKPNGQITENQLIIDHFRFREEEDIAYAIDNDFINNNPEDFLHSRVKVFARITPENKGLIVRRHKEMIASKTKARSFWKRIFGECSVKVGMVGDGANDLIAIKDADVGIAISSSDAAYSAAFTIKDLSQIVDILREAKSTERQIVELTQYYTIINFVCITNSLILVTDVANLTSAHEIYRTFIISLPIALYFSFSKPAKYLSKFLPNSNFMGVENHLIFWANCLILAAGQLAAYLYYHQTDDFVPNPYPAASYQQGWNGLCKSTTVNFLIIILEYSLLPIFIYRSSPWKEQIYKNKILLIWIILNIVLSAGIFFQTSNLSFLDLQPIDPLSAGIVFGITLFACLDCGLVNRIIQRAKMHEELTGEQKEEMMSLQ